MKLSKRKIVFSAIALLMATSMTSGVVASAVGTDFSAWKENVKENTSSANVSSYSGILNTNKSNYFDNSVVYKLPETVAKTDELSLIIHLNETALLDAHDKAASTLSVAEYAKTAAGKKVVKNIEDKSAKILQKLDYASIPYTMGAKYDTILAGFEITVEARYFERVENIVKNDGVVIVGESYERCETQIVTNDITEGINDTGIFKGDNPDGYDGTGVVVAVLDTGLDYTHSAFSVDNFTADRSKLGFTIEDIADVVATGDLCASSTTAELKAEDVYLNEKVPYAYDYADFDTQVLPLSSEHGTHVAGIIAGKDDVITGVAPNAQLAIMKVFSDTAENAKTSWIISAVEDCVTLDVDIINMSLGTSCGFSREIDRERVAVAYDAVQAHGISLIAAASNSYNSTYGSEKNGNYSLTSNPDFGTVGSPSTYDGALSVASINASLTPYLTYNGRVIYFDEVTNAASKPKDFVKELFGGKDETKEYEYVTIPGVGRSADYTGYDVTGKIALVRRGSTTFEEKVKIAQSKGAAAIIIYNNVSGEIKMNVGTVSIPACSIAQDDGEILAAQETGKITIGTSQKCGPFMSDFSSWGPTSDLKIKPEITAQGGEITSAVPGGTYDSLSGTSMASPNMAGGIAVIRQYVKDNFTTANNYEVNNIVNELVMSTADIVINKNGLPYSVRKQGAGVANIKESVTTPAYITAYDKNGNKADKPKFELGDDPSKTGVYTMKFDINNISSSALSYNVDAYVLTEGVSATYTSHGETTVTQSAYDLDDAKIEIVSVNGGSNNGAKVSVAAKSTATVTVKITLGEKDREYLDKSFANGMYVEGFITLKAVEGTTIDLSAPYLGFYGDWTKAPILDEEYYDTNADELDEGIDPADKLMADAYPTRAVGGIMDDYVSYLGCYYFVQNPMATPIPANRDHIAISNQASAVNNIRYVWAGLLRNAMQVDVVITEDSTGRVAFESTGYNKIKSYAYSGATIYYSSIDVGFDSFEKNLKNNTKYTVTMKTYMDYDYEIDENGNVVFTGGKDTNERNTFTFPLYIDFESPAVTNVTYRTEYDKTEDKTHLYADIEVYDNHYAMAMQPGYVHADAEGNYDLTSFDKYFTPIYSSFNSTTMVTYELTDHMDEIRKSANPATFVVSVYDYALNEAVYELSVPQNVIDLCFTEESLTLSPNETVDLGKILDLYPATNWTETLSFTSSNTAVAEIVNGTLIAKASGTARITASSISNKTISDRINVTVLKEGDEGYQVYTQPIAQNFTITGYYVDKAFYEINSTDRDIGSTGYEMPFLGYNLSMYPSESVTLRYKLYSYFPDAVSVRFESNNEKVARIATISNNLNNIHSNLKNIQTGRIVAVAEGTTSVCMYVDMADGRTLSETIWITVKNPYITSGPMLTAYRGAGDDNYTVEIPESLALTEIGQYAFSNYEYVAKGEDEVIDREDPTFTKPVFIGEKSIKKIVIPEGIEKIDGYAFAGLTALEEVVLPSTLRQIGYGAFYGCDILSKINLENVKFINDFAFNGCFFLQDVNVSSVVAFGNYAFASSGLTKIVLPATAQSIGSYAFAYNESLASVTMKADKVEVGDGVFMDCRKLTSVSINAAVIPQRLFAGCSRLNTVTFGKDVSVIDEYAFTRTKLTSLNVEEGNSVFAPAKDATYLLDVTGTKLLFVASSVSGEFVLDNAKVTSIGNGAFSNCSDITSVKISSVKNVGDYAFAGCNKLRSVEFGELDSIGAYAFYNTAINEIPRYSEKMETIGAYAFYGTKLTSVTIPEGMNVGEGAFEDILSLNTVVIKDGAIIGGDAFRVNESWIPYKYTYRSNDGILGESSTQYIYYRLGYTDFEFSNYYTAQEKALYATYGIKNLTIGNNVILGESAFYGAEKLKTVNFSGGGEGVVIGAAAFYNNKSLESIDLSKIEVIGEAAFYGQVDFDIFYSDGQEYSAINNDNEVIYNYITNKLTFVDLSSVKELGNNAFTNSEKLEKVVLNPELTYLPKEVFMETLALKSIDLSGVTSIGDGALYDTGLDKVDLTGVTKIGSYAFATSVNLKEVTLDPNGSVIYEGAFSDCPALETVSNMGKVTYFGAYAFADTGFATADISSAQYVGPLAFAESKVTKVVIGDNHSLVVLGDNPFMGCNIPAFSKSVVTEFNGKDYIEDLSTFDVSNTVKVFDGALYQVLPNGGYELISYPSLKTSSVYSVAEGTTRIGEYAFIYNDYLKKVELPQSLMAIGDKAFYQCSALNTVIFKSIKAPILEETYNYSLYANFENISSTGVYDFTYTDGSATQRVGLGIVPYYIWNVADNAGIVYYGANFVDMIGYLGNDLSGEYKAKLTMVRPSNGLNYDSFVYAQYFDFVIDGATAPDAITLNAIAAIDAIPDYISLAPATVAAVEDARAAYNMITAAEQQALVTNLDKLTNAESTIRYLQMRENENPDDDPKTEVKDNAVVIYVVLGVVAGLCAAAAVVFAVLYFKKNPVVASGVVEPSIEEETEEKTDKQD